MLAAAHRGRDRHRCRGTPIRHCGASRIVGIGCRRGGRNRKYDQRAREALSRAGLGDKLLHRTGHSLDTSLFGDGANLDDHDTHDTRTLVMGSGFTVGPGVYVSGDFGVRSVIDVFIGRKGVEVTSPVQQQVTAVLAP